MRTSIFILAITLLSFRCQKDDLPYPDKETSLPLGTVDILLNNCGPNIDSASSAAICFHNVEDSRCPLNVQCVWEGVAVGKFSLSANSTRYPFILATKKFPGGPSTDTTIAGRHIKLVNILPYPGGSTEPTHAVLQIQ